MGVPVIWINGPFGVGKTHTAAHLQERVSGSFLFDPEELGFTLQHLTPGSSGDFQRHPLWVPFVLDALEHAARTAEGPVIVPMTVTDLTRHAALMGGLRNRDLSVHHFTLLAPPDVIHSRLRRRAQGRQSWAGRQVEARLSDLKHPAFATHLNTGELRISQVAQIIAARAGLTLAPEKRDPLRWFRVTTRRFLR